MCEELFTYSSEAIQLLCLFSKEENLALAVLYRQPDDKTHGHPSTPSDFKAALNGLATSILGIQNATLPEIIFGRDFNLPHTAWPSGTPSTGANTEEKIMIKYLNEFCCDLMLNQIITKPTHKDGNTLDLVFLNNIVYVF